MAKKTITIRVREDIYEKIRNAANARYMNMTAWFISILVKELEPSITHAEKQRLADERREKKTMAREAAKEAARNLRKDLVKKQIWKQGRKARIAAMVQECKKETERIEKEVKE